MRPFEEGDLFNFPLTPDSLVIDVGGFEGNWANQIARKYGCSVICYEPVRAFYVNIIDRMARGQISPKVMVIHAGLGAYARKESFGVKGDQSGIACSGNYNETVSIVDAGHAITTWMKDSHRDYVDVLKLNCENMEYEILESLLTRDLVRTIRNIVVQFHAGLPDFAERHERICAQIGLTHDMTFDSPFCWTGWSLRV